MDRNALILLASGPDRPGIVDRISGLCFEAGCNLEDSRMSILGGEFALMLLVTGSPDRLEEMEASLSSVARELDLTFQLKPPRAADELPEAGPAIGYRLSAVSLDHPGIVHRITHLLSRHRVNVARLDTRLGHAPVTGTRVFSLDLEAQVPADVSVSALRGELATLAESENIDIELRPAEG